MNNKKLIVDHFITIDSKDYYSTEVFAEITCRSAQAIRLLVSKGNRVRKLKAITFGRNLMIEKSELVDFPFTCAGRSKLVYHYDVDGNETTSIKQ